MDPTETLRLLQDAYLTAQKITAFGLVNNATANPWSKVIDHAENLADWLNMGGFPPKNHTRESVRKHMIPMVNAARKHLEGNEG